MKRLILDVGMALLLTVSTVWAGPFEDASDAIQRGDYATAFKIIQPLAAQGDAGAQYNLGAMYLQGHEVPQDFTEAVKWFHLSAAQGHAEAQNNLGVMHLQGHGVPQDFTEAVKWFRLAAAQGYADAQSSLGAMYVIGYGVAQDIVRAYMWFNLGAMSGDRDSVKHRDVVARRMTPAQVSEAQRLALQCQAQQFKGC
jgi:uncharacterized protein